MRVAISLDDELGPRLYAERLGRGHQVQFPSTGVGLHRLAANGALDVAVVGVLSDDALWPQVLEDLAEAAPALAIVAVLDTSRPSIDEAAELARGVPRVGFVSRPDSRFDYLARRRTPSDRAPTFAAGLLDAVDTLPLAGVGRDFARLQALRPSLAFDIPEQAAAFGAGRRKLERWFQGPDICSARRLQSVCAASEAMYLRIAHHASERDTASAIALLTRDGAPNPIGVGREIRAAFGEGRDTIREGGIGALAEAVSAELRRARVAERLPARWEGATRYWPAKGVLAGRRDDRVVLVDPAREVERALDEFCADAWALLERGSTFAELAAELATLRGEAKHHTRARLKECLGALLVLGLIHRGAGGATATEGA
jgi:hypothetical protein